MALTHKNVTNCSFLYLQANPRSFYRKQYMHRGNENALIISFILVFHRSINVDIELVRYNNRYGT
jgi:hypothetical protein